LLRGWQIIESSQEVENKVARVHQSGPPDGHCHVLTPLSDCLAKGECMKNLALMAEYDCFAIWDRDTPDNLNADVLPISDQLKSRIHAWEAAFEATQVRDDPVASGFSDPSALAAFDEEGRQIWRTLIEELGGGYYVRYYSPATFEYLDPETA
jgi:hypothetical protein